MIMEAEHDALMQAIYRNDVAEVEQIIERGLELNYPYDEGASLLYTAILDGRLGIVQLMLEAGANPNFVAEEPAASVYAEKPLDLALQARFLMDWEKFAPIVKTLIDYGATDYEGHTETPDERAVNRRCARRHGCNKTA